MANSLTELADLLAAHVGGDDDAELSFSQIDVPPALTLPPGGVGLADLRGFIVELLEKEFGLKGVNDSLPNLDALKAVFLTRFEIDLRDSLANSGFFLGLELHVDWPLIEHDAVLGGLAISNPGVTIGRVGPGDWELDLYGKVDLPGGPYAVTASWPGKRLSATYVGPGIDVAAFLKQLGVPLEGFGFKIDEAFLSADIPNEIYSFAMGLEGFAIPHVPLKLGQTRLQVEHQKGQVSAAVQSQVIVGGVEVDITAAYSPQGLAFSGRSAADEKLPLGKLIEDVVGKLTGSPQAVSLPGALRSLEITAISVSFETGPAAAFQFICEARLEGDGTPVALGVKVDIDSQKKLTLGGHLMIGDLQFDLRLEAEGADGGGKVFAATFAPEEPLRLGLVDLVAKVTHDEAALALVPPLEMQLDDIVIAYVDPEDGKASKVFGLALGAKLDLTALPLVGSALSKLGGFSAGMDNLQVVLASADVAAKDLQTLNRLLPQGATPLPTRDAPADSGSAEAATEVVPALKKGFNFFGNLKLGEQTMPVSTSSSSTGDTKATAPATPADHLGGKNASQATSAVVPPSGNAEWFNIHKALGPLYFDKIGLRYEKGEIWFLLNANFSVARLTISLDGLAVSSPLDKFSPTFHLQGLGIDYSNGPVEISGAFSRFEGKEYEEYCGSVVLKTKTLSLAAIGSYARVQGEPSLFVYLTLDKPLGGPPFFFVTGLTGGFGYNRALKIPPIEKLRQFPFIASALAKAEPAPATTAPALPGQGSAGSNLQAMQSSLTGQLQSLQEYVPPEVGEHWLAIGIHFTSFKVVDAFALLTVAFGHRFEVHLLGTATYVYPPAVADAVADPKATPKVVPTLARVEMNFEGSYLPDEGTLEVRALVADGSYIYSGDCHLTGGIAFKSWFAGPKKDEFVFTLGGYHPKFKIPDDYPLVDRLGFNWLYSPELHVKGGVYFSMTGHALMAGGFLDATWDSGAISAWLKISADFLVRYKPFHYDAQMSIDIGAQVTIEFFGTHHLSVNLGANLHLWGPEFSGTASFSIWVASFDIAFGATIDAPPALEWAKFRESFLPADDAIVGIAVEAGLVNALKGFEVDKDHEVVANADSKATHWLINPRQFALVTHSVIPASIAGAGGRVGVAPMDLRNDEFQVSHDIVIRRGGETEPVTEDFLLEPVRRPVPAGLWGNVFTVDVNAHPVVADALSGYRVVPRKQPECGAPRPIDAGKLAFDTEVLADAFRWIGDDGADEKAESSWRTLGASWDEDPDLAPTDLQARTDLLEQFFDPAEVTRMSGRVAASDLLLGRAPPRRVQ